jgi:hypothetical protein
MQEDFSAKTGEGIYRRAALSLDKVTFNGNEGFFSEQEKDAKRDEQTGKYPKKTITQAGEPLEVVFLKIRRVLSAYSKKATMRTNEHNHKADLVTLYKPDGKKEYGLATEIRDNNPTLKTQQIVYCWIPKEDKVVRVTIKGSSLGSDFKHKEKVLKFYDYLQSFGTNEHSHEFVTKITPVKEEGPQGDYFSISFVKGAKLDEEELVKVKDMINDLHERILAIDARMDVGSKVSKKSSSNLPTVDINDIPVIDDTKGTSDEGDEEDEDDEEGGAKFPKSEEIDVKDIPF